MPLRSAISRVPHCWVVCAFCSLALAIISFKNTCFYAIDDIVKYVTEKRKIPTGGCPFLFAGSSWERQELPFYVPNFYFNPKFTEIADSAFYLGKMLMVVPAGVVSDLGYSWYVLGGGMLLVAASYLLLPTFSVFGVTVYVVLSIVDGVGEALIYPSIFTLISRWARPSERNFFTALVMAGSYCGDTLGYELFNLFFVGFRSWSFGHHITGAVVIVWLAFWSVFTYYTPVAISFIPPRHSTTTNTHRKRTLLIEMHKLHGIPWRKIFSSPPFLSLVLADCSLTWATYSSVWKSLVPYQDYILHLPIEFNKYSNMMAIAVLPTLLMGALFGDWVIKRNITSKTVIKRTFAFISVFCSSILQVTLPLVGCNVILFWVLAITTMYVVGLAVPVIFSTPIDLSPRHAGLLMGIMTCARTICFLFDANIFKTLVTDPYNRNHWQDKFLFFAVAALILMVPFILFGSGGKQRWKFPTLLQTHPDEQPPIELETAGGPLPQQ